MARLAALMMSLALFAGCASEEKRTGFEAEAPLDRLAEGNARFVDGHPRNAGRDAARRTETAAGQKPFAVVVGCADSRVAPELLFDQGLGDLFVIRVAGHVVDDPSLGSIEYAVEHLGARFIVVLAHEKCGAVKAALDGGHAEGHIGALVEAIRPSIAGVAGDDKLDAAVRANAIACRDRLRKSDPILKKRVDAGELTIEAARYDLDSGAVEFLK